MGSPGGNLEWTWDLNKALEIALVECIDEEEPSKWEKIAARVPGKSAEEIKAHHDLLLLDVEAIEEGRVPFPKYVDAPEGSAELSDDGGGKKGGGKASKSEHERRKGIAWTEDEHRLFLLGLDKYGKGDWRSISRNFVVTRTPTQVASHAQKYFIRQSSINKDRRRSSIHDITSIGNGEGSASQGPITGESTVPSVAVPAKPCNPSSTSGTVYGSPATGQPVGGPHVPAVGTPVSIPAVTPVMAYGVRAPMPRAVVPGTPVNAPAPGSRPKQHASRRR